MLSRVVCKLSPSTIHNLSSHRILTRKTVRLRWGLPVVCSIRAPDGHSLDNLRRPEACADSSRFWRRVEKGPQICSLTATKSTGFQNRLKQVFKQVQSILVPKPHATERTQAVQEADRTALLPPHRCPLPVPPIFRWGFTSQISMRHLH